MSSTYGDGGQLPSWDPLGPGTQPLEPTTHSGRHEQPYQPQPYQPQPYQPQPYQQAYPPPVWVAPVPTYPYAVWIRRVGSYLIDFAPAYLALIPFYIGYAMMYVRLIQASMSGNPDLMSDAISGTPLVLMGIGLVLAIAAIGWQWYNRWLIAGRTGQSMGKRVLNTRLVAEVNGQPIGALNAFLRDLLHALDGIAYVGFLWPLWDAKRQTFADMIMKTVVVDLRVQPGTPMVGHGRTPDGTA